MQNTNGILCYGVDLGEAFDELEPCAFLDAAEADDDFEPEEYVTDRLLEAAGFTEADPYPYREDRERTPDERKAHMAWCRRRREAEEALPVELVRHCSDGCPMHILAARPVHEAYRGDPEEIDLRALADPAVQDAREVSIQGLVDQVVWRRPWGEGWARDEWV